ncbi:CPBP family intramembrane glutamic endopeptidase [Neisseria wadsworthii]|uniref:CAAX amino protease n=1 Tax=Neisseria wadsworthii 9715 TaxID=1030841 RepID=G4CMS3_9NEIS|nr:CPBP family intramembrane glutamic endopeptidase [Neisseria wadsworthii]EGZ50973.1 CAAX amino protease [Neisseria wadsworthii 9715]QMT36393.1 CPBP family intramembrane metalloprotease [Neisseria wadsworthii]
MNPPQHTVNPAVYRPVLFFIWSLLLPWALWFAAAYLSHQPDGGHKGLLTALLLAGLLAPVCLAAGLLWWQPSLRADALSRLRLSGAPKRYLLAAVLLPPLSLVLAQGLSLLFGYPAAQFHISGSPSFTSALISPWLALVLGAVLEELAWHSYGTDALLSRFSLFAASLVFTVYWALWHVPLGLVKGYYHSELVAQGWLYTANFVASMVVFVLLMNWLYLKSGRSIVVAMLFHLAANLGNEIFHTHPDSKVIQTGILLLLTAWVLWKERALFFRRPQFKQAT